MVAAEQENGSSVAMAAGNMNSKAQLVSVKRGEPSLVAPAEPTPTGEHYYLSNLDQNIAVIVQTVYCFKCPPSGRGHEAGAADALRDALSRVLVHYHPLAGRLAISPEMKLAVDCTGEGVLFTEADGDVRLDQSGDDPQPPFPCLDELIFDVLGSSALLDDPLLLF